MTNENNREDRDIEKRMPCLTTARVRLRTPHKTNTAYNVDRGQTKVSKPFSGQQGPYFAGKSPSITLVIARFVRNLMGDIDHFDTICEELLLPTDYRSDLFCLKIK
mmetsp:Transcript_31868/g.77408  ORF Transcript_31868/g.77408 Transcript_31868/m.77408 type:complete len:106 (-) Transcript_31868:141-458(-)